MMKATVYGMSCREIIIFLVLLYKPKKNTSLSVYGDSDTNATYRNIKERFTSVRKMNEIQARAREIVQTELIFV
jgi:hypothetical protein